MKQTTTDSPSCLTEVDFDCCDEFLGPDGELRRIPKKPRSENMPLRLVGCGPVRFCSLGAKRMLGIIV